MNTALSIAIDEAFFQARKALNEEAPTEAFSWLERAHILSQRMPILHAQSHWLMLRAGWQLRDLRRCSAKYRESWRPCCSRRSGCRSETAGAPGSVLLRRCLFHRSCSDFFKEKCNEVVS